LTPHPVTSRVQAMKVASVLAFRMSNLHH